MMLDLYPRLALDGILKNRRLYLPYLLTCVGMVMMFYILNYLYVSPAVEKMHGGPMIQETLRLGSWVMALFSVLFLFYTNAFLMRRRQKEFGLYNILGMGKGNLSWILLWESVILGLVSLGAGLLGGAGFAKLAELALLNIGHGEVDTSLTVPSSVVLITITVYGGVFLLLFLNSMRKIRFSTAIRLLRSENVGEKPPRANWILGLAGFVLLGVAYRLAVTIENPVSAITIFFVAVMMVIVATYLILISGSVLLCRILQHNKAYYYKPNHFVSVSSMVYRMRRNGAGLASICILSTMVLVMMASTASLYFGGEESLRTRYPRELDLLGHVSDEEGDSLARMARTEEELMNVLTSHGGQEQERICYRYVTTSGMMEDGTVNTDFNSVTNFSLDMLNNVYNFYFLPLEDYNAMMGTEETLAPGEALLYGYRCSYGGETMSFDTGASIRIRDQLKDFPGNGDSTMDMMSSFFLVVPDLQEALRLAGPQGDLTDIRWVLCFDTGLEPEAQQAVAVEMRTLVRDEEARERMGLRSGRIESREENRQEFYAINGSLFFLGIFLSVVFLVAAVLIIYYKQITEGYEDQGRFAIMRKVGMTKREIRRSINSQLLTVFYLPLALAVLHLLFAFPIVYRLLLLFNLNNIHTFAITTGICILAFALFYTLTYRLTSNAYYRIVSGTGEI